MWWLKLIVGALVVLFGVAVGYFAAGKYRLRKEFFAEFAAFNERYLGELTYARRPLKEFLTAYSYEGEFKKLLSELQTTGGVRAEKRDFLSEEEKTLVGDYFSMLGRGDSRSQIDYFSSRKRELTEKKEGSEREAKQRGELYLKLGLLAGLAVVILIV